MMHRVFFGATDPIRTDDLLITSELLYLLSHSSTLLEYYIKRTRIRQEEIFKKAKNPRLILKQNPRNQRVGQ